MRSDAPGWSQQGNDAPRHLDQRHDGEGFGGLRVLGMRANGARMDGAGADGGGCRDHERSRQAGGSLGRGRAASAKWDVDGGHEWLLAR